MTFNIPSNVESIGLGAFNGCSLVESITIPFVGKSANATLNEALFGYIFGSDIYSGCTAVLQNFDLYEYVVYTLPTSLRSIATTQTTSIPFGAFSGIRYITSITISDSVTYISDYAFYDCRQLSRLNSEVDGVFNLPNNLIYIGSLALSYCYELLSIYFPSSVEEIGTGLFEISYNLTTVSLPENLHHLPADIFTFCENLVNIELPEGLLSIGYRAFYQCSSLTSINIPSSVTSIGELSFSRCTSLTSINSDTPFTFNIPTSVESIGLGAFRGCSLVQSITLPFVGRSANATLEEGLFGYIFGDFYYTDSTAINQYYNDVEFETYYIPDSLTEVIIIGFGTISFGAFSNCTTIESIIISDGVSIIEQLAFLNCDSLTIYTYFEERPEGWIFEEVITIYYDGQW
jgi:hypothetical protein